MSGFTQFVGASVKGIRATPLLRIGECVVTRRLWHSSDLQRYRCYSITLSEAWESTMPITSGGKAEPELVSTGALGTMIGSASGWSQVSFTAHI